MDSLDTPLMERLDMDALACGDGPAARPRDPVALPVAAAGWQQGLGIVISATTFATMAYQLRSVDLHAVLALLPRSPLFWLVFAAYYCAPVAAEWIIFRRLWRLPAGAMSALTRKYVSNELLLGYLGDAYLYVWARRRGSLSAAPFGAIKDSAILSALAGNCLTLVLLAAIYPDLARLFPGWESQGRAIYLSLVILVTTSAAALLLRRRLFSLPAPDLRFILTVHVARAVAMILLAALMWHLALPGIWLGWWLLLATLRQLISRLPLLPNKDLAFAGIATLLVGGNSALAALLTMIAGLLILSHIAAGSAALAFEFANSRT